MAESDASEISVVNLVDLSDQIDTARAEVNSRAERDSRAEPRVVDMENWNDQNIWRSEKKQT